MNAVFHPPIAILQSNSLPAVVQQEIEHAIRKGEYGLGSELNEANQAEKMGVSRGRVREAFRTLEEAELVRNEKNHSVFLRSIPIEEAQEIFELRAAMGELVGRLFAKNITLPLLKGLKSLVSAMRQAVKDEDAYYYDLLNPQFHDRLVAMAAMAGNRQLTDIYRKLIKALPPYLNRNVADAAVGR